MNLETDAAPGRCWIFCKLVVAFFELKKPSDWSRHHLGNVRSLIADYRAADGSGNPIAALEHYAHYYPFGMMQPGRNGNRYRFGFNGMEMDNELKGTGNSYDFGARIYDPRIAKWMSVDPLQIKFPAYSPYIFALNSPLLFVDPDGRDTLIVHRSREAETYGDAKIYKITFSIVRNGVQTPLDAPPLWMMANAQYERKGDNDLQKYKFYKLNGDQMGGNPFPVGREIRVTDFGIFIHPGNSAGSFAGCLGVTCIPPVTTSNDAKIYATGDKTFKGKWVESFAQKQGVQVEPGEGVKGGLFQMWEIYDQANGGPNGDLLTGDKWLLQPNSEAPITRMESRPATLISMEKDEPQLIMKSNE